MTHHKQSLTNKAKALLGAKADVNAKTSDQRVTALMIAATKGHIISTREWYDLATSEHT